MLEIISSATKTWVAKAILIFITVPFALWGVESYVRTPAGLDTVATVEKEKITTQEFQQAGRQRPPGVVREFLLFLRTNKKFWLLPLLSALLLLGLVALLGGTAAAPFIYSLF